MSGDCSGRPPTGANGGRYGVYQPQQRIASYVAIGDSFTEGLNDELPDGDFRGWADRLAEILAQGRDDVRYANLALRGKMLDESIDEQLPAALEQQPDPGTLGAGGKHTSAPA